MDSYQCLEVLTHVLYRMKCLKEEVLLSFIVARKRFCCAWLLTHYDTTSTLYRLKHLLDLFQDEFGRVEG